MDAYGAYRCGYNCRKDRAADRADLRHTKLAKPRDALEMELVVAGKSTSRKSSNWEKADRAFVAAFGIFRRRSFRLDQTALIRGKAGLLVTFLPMGSLADLAAIESHQATGAWLEERILGAAEAAIECWPGFLDFDVNHCVSVGRQCLGGGTDRNRFGCRGPQLVRGHSCNRNAD